MHAGQAEDEEEVFRDSLQYQPPPGMVVSSSPGRDLASTPFFEQQNLTHSSSDDVAALTAAIERMRTEKEALERQTEVSRLQAELHALQRFTPWCHHVTSHHLPSGNSTSRLFVLIPPYQRE